ncbi:hypothetical protein WBJ53_07110 [Spirosoma sp. SC4-14]|uniref:hypothetical protein n=1 Tax=Spirosoma sp. SC4-14 TaxID=3128900 RepID=UPI0030D62796
MKRYALSFFIQLVIAGAAFSQQANRVSEKLWKPQNDDVYPQEISVKIATPAPVNAIAEAGGICLALMANKIYRVGSESLLAEPTAPADITKLQTEQGEIWALGTSGLYVYRNRQWKKVDNRAYVDLCTHLGTLHAATVDEIFRFENGTFVSTRPADGYYGSDVTMIMEDGSQIHADPVALGPITQIESYSGTLYVLRPGKLALFDGKTVNEDFIDWGRLPSTDTNELLSVGNRVYVGTDRGLGELRGAALKHIKGSDGLPVEQTTCLSQGFANDVWIGTKRGAVRMVGSEFHYFGEGMWLPGSWVNDIAVGNNAAYIATDKGIGIVRYEPFTLLKKAAWFERHMNEWGHKRLGFVHLLYKKGDEWIREISDNDGGNTATYLAAMCYKYAATGDKEARAAAVESFNALIWLNKITGKDGYIARSVWSTTGDKGERGKHGSGGLPAKWYLTKDGKWYWKGDTSSDEVTSHFYVISLFLDLVAEGKEKEIAQDHLRKMATYIIDCGWTMHDLDGKPTRWARWNPEYLLRPYGYMDRGLNGLEVLSYMESAIAATGEQKFRDGYRQLINWGYPTNTLRQKNTFPPETIAPWDDNLAFMSYYTLLRYASDPVLRSIYLRSLERTWEVKRADHLPWFNFTYGALTGNDCEQEQSVKFLRERVLDCRENSYFNAHRADLFIESGYTAYDGSVKTLSPREAFTDGDSRRVNQLDNTHGGNRIKDPSGFLRDYWMGRYYGFIKTPATNDPTLISVPQHAGKSGGATPYSGPARPNVY